MTTKSFSNEQHGLDDADHIATLRHPLFNHILTTATDWTDVILREEVRPLADRLERIRARGTHHQLSPREEQSLRDTKQQLRRLLDAPPLATLPEARIARRLRDELRELLTLLTKGHERTPALDEFLIRSFARALDAIRHPTQRVALSEREYRHLTHWLKLPLPHLRPSDPLPLDLNFFVRWSRTSSLPTILPVQFFPTPTTRH